VTLDELNMLPRDKAEAEFMRCCGSTRWAKEMVNLRPFKSVNSVYASGDRTWLTLGEADWMEAFSHHPRIGDGALLEQKFAVEEASRETLERLKVLNQEYEKRFPHVFLICATGKSAIDMLKNLEMRLTNDRKHELSNASAEQMKITRLRLEKLLT
jgi:2-oxo-4-hydroxy-4-carboxy-5-ureidoimidazoline decarboxylase